MKQEMYICFDASMLPEVDAKKGFQQLSLFHFYFSLKKYTPFIAYIKKGNSVQASLLGVIVREKNLIPAFLFSRCLIVGHAELYDDEISLAETYTLLLPLIDREVNIKCLYTEFRLPDSDKVKQFVFEKYKYVHYPWYNVINDLRTDVITPPKTRQIKRGLSRGATIVEAATEKQVTGFYHILKKLYQHIKKPIPDIDFFIHFFREYCKKGKGVYLLVQYNNVIIGGIMCLFDDETIYEWYVASEHKNEFKRFYPGVLSTYAALEYGKIFNFNYFDFMGAGQQNTSYPVRDFKKTFGGKLINTSRWKKINFPAAYKIVVFFSKLFVKVD